MGKFSYFVNFYFYYAFCDVNKPFRKINFAYKVIQLERIKVAKRTNISERSDMTQRA